MFSESVNKNCQRQPEELKLSKLIAHSKFHKICKFKNHVTKNDVIIRTMETDRKCGPPRNQTYFISFERY